MHRLVIHGGRRLSLVRTEGPGDVPTLPSDADKAQDLQGRAVVVHCCSIHSRL